MTQISNPKFENVMIIDDSEIDIFITSRLIVKHSFAKNIIKFNDAIQALNYLIENQNNSAALPEIILLDIMMPLMTGFEFMEIYNKLPYKIKKHCKVYIVSSSQNHKDINAANCDSNVIGFHIKPLNTNFLDSIPARPKN